MSVEPKQNADRQNQLQNFLIELAKKTKYRRIGLVLPLFWETQ